MQKVFFILTALLAILLSGCTLSSQLSVPQQITHNKHTYELVAQQDLGPMARFFYLEKGESLSHWKSAVELLLDRNQAKTTLDERIALRERVYRNTGVKNFKLQAQDDSLYAFVIYEPTVKNNDWQVDVAKGKTVQGCGFVQYQYSLKIPRTKKIRNMSNKKVVRYLKKYVVEKEMKHVKNRDWQWICE
ncbi:hypothetical protein PcPA57_09730 [Pasteurella canis]|uniref:hypothetical protein n=1 Tax=Pasteurella canis TaxID=753 RepID=UPI000D9DAB52|nr:hypothetical protein [Pasteurella canis]GJJ80253.1 hypothetical protein PcPA57_09730 [Pasteurella canis]SPY33674.1 Uncharacterised protein [Pasteurella canis]